jgi:transposase-like protein
VRERQHSGLSIRAFCRERKLAESAFYYWRRELQRRQAEQEQRPRSDSPDAPAFVAVRVEPPTVPATRSRIEIVLSGGRRVHVVGPVDRTALVDVLTVLEGMRC